MPEPSDPSGANRLAAESSPYLRQHAHNPVDWYPWGQEALAKAKTENKPLLVSIGYAACHWCHVMERESFEDPDVAAYMNAAFVNIKVDREERPDLDHLYMESVQAMTGSGGWPLNVFCTPDGRPFSGGTYFPPQSMPARPSWRTVLQRIARAFAEQRPRVEEQADLLLNHLQQRHSAQAQKTDQALPNFDQVLVSSGAEHPFAEGLPGMAEGLLRDADKELGGFGKAPKFPSPHALRFLLRHGVAYRNRNSMEHALHSLSAMARGGIHDHLGGGFARYATDPAWLVPHFEKMLYDNALLLSAFSEAVQAEAAFNHAHAVEQPKGSSVFAEQAKNVVKGIVDWAVREMRHPDGAFYATLDADSADDEGRMVEGAFYTWSLDELHAVLGSDAELFARAYGLRQPGWWEGTNILYQAEDWSQFAESEGLTLDALHAQLSACRSKLFAHRSHRPRPGLDNKVILSWNALFCSGLFRAQAAFAEPAYGQLARQALDFLDRALRADHAPFHHVWQEGRARFPAYLDDLAGYACACIDAADAALDSREMANRLQRAEAAVEHMLQSFLAGEGPWFYYSPAEQSDLVARSIDRYDGATPSANALAADALLRLGRLLDRPKWTEHGMHLLSAVQKQAQANPGAFGHWGCSLMEEAIGRAELVCIGPQAQEWRAALQAQFRPGTLYATGASGSHEPSTDNAKPARTWPLLEGREYGAPGIFLCRNYACSAPVTRPGDVQAWGNPYV